MPAYAYIVLAVGWLVWVTPFFLAKRGRPKAATLDRRARWGILLVGIAFALVFQNPFREKVVAGWQVALSVLFLALASILSWTGARTLGLQWRVDAGLNADHQLVTAGPYRVIRHPIYTSILCLMWGVGVMLAPWQLFLAATVLALVGTEIRVRIEDRLLASRFGEQFRQYQQSVPAYLPFIR